MKQYRKGNPETFFGPCNRTHNQGHITWDVNTKECGGHLLLGRKTITLITKSIRVTNFRIKVCLEVYSPNFTFFFVRKFVTPKRYKIRIILFYKQFFVIRPF